MAVEFRLSNKAQSSTYSFLTGNLRPADRTTTANGDGWVTETMTLVGRTTDANILAAVNMIDELAEKCELWWSDTTYTASIWLEENAADETAKRALVQSITLAPITEGWFTPELGKVGAKYVCVIVRSAAWEVVTGPMTNDENISVLGGTRVYSATYGSLPARIPIVNITSVNNATASTMWLGIRPTASGTSDFNPVWQFESGTLSGGAVVASDSDNASPLGSTDNIITYAATSDETLFAGITMEQGRGSTDSGSAHYLGDYTVLGRMKASTTDGVRVRMTWGMANSARTYQNPYVFITETDYHFYEFGNITIPPFPRFPYTALGQFKVAFFAMCLGGTPTLTGDCIVLVPSTHYAKMTGLSMHEGSADVVKLITLEDGINYATVFSTTDANYDANVQLSTRDWGLPIEGGIVVFVSEDSTGSSLVANENLFTVTLEYLNRYRTHADS